MPGSRLTLRAITLAAIFAVTSAIPASQIFARQDTCFKDYISCGIPELPGSFCCPRGQKCLVLAGKTTVLCCPAGSSCRKIEPLPSCDLSLQDGEKNPDVVVKTTALKGTLPRCGDKCCPFGYSCQNNECIMNADQNVAPAQSGAPSTGTAGPTSAATSNPTATGTKTDPAPTGTKPAESDSTNSASPSESTGPPIAGIAGGAAAGAVVLIVAVILAIIFMKKKKAGKSKSGSPYKLSRSTSSFGNIISGPIMQQDTLRTDFARIPAPRTLDNDPGSVTGAMLDDQSMFSSPGNSSNGSIRKPPPAARMSSVAYGYGGPSPPTKFNDPSPQIPSQYARMPYMPRDDDYDDRLIPQTPRQGREPSSVSINVFADPNITPDRTPETGNDKRYTDMTTFTRMLDSADLSGVARGEETFVPYDQPGRR
ncbi:hypothetical protein QBC42DRAFT_321423 [Cladorrhinum samala]|uniref:Mid2 domain-containing protein n=1 Tax=Cladorrhinum samala TaxID=585594 RepID=A0AAV9HU39_9PEZI|nr:hypothetical protein QBC42DRAFT_321423 [Cladorrhinum samala]